MDQHLSLNSKRSTLLRSILVLGVFILGIGLRLYDLTDQPIDFHPTRQLRGAIIARGMYYEMSPGVDETTQKKALAFWRSTGQYEPSVLERLVAITYLAIGKEILWISRIYTTIFWAIGGMALFALAKRMAAQFDAQADGVETPREINTASFGAALVALAYYMLLPFAVQASRSFQPDPGMVMWILLAVYSLYRWSEESTWKWAILSGVLAGIAVLTKAVAAYTIAGAAIALVLYNIKRTSSWVKLPLKVLGNLQVWVMALLMTAPTAIYYLTREERAAKYFSSWTVALSHLLLEPWFYLRWLNLVQKLMVIIPLILALAGVWFARGRIKATLIGLWAGYLAYGLFLPYQMYTHNYYHLQLIPIVALSLIPMTKMILQEVTKQPKIWRILLAGSAVVIVTFAAWMAIMPQYSQDHRNEPAHWQGIASQLPQGGKIVALTQDYGYRLMYYGWRKVTLWPNRGERKLSQLRGSEKKFEDYFSKRTDGKSFFLVTSFRQFTDQPTLKQTLYDNYPILAEGNGYIIFDLRPIE